MPGQPLIVLVDDRASSLADLREAVERRYGADYRTVAHGSPQAALAELTRARADGDDVALIIADQWMPEMTGGDLLERAHELHPDAQRALLVAWGDKRASETILQGCALGKLDNYLLKPWAPAEVYLYPIVSAFLAEWTRTHGPRLELIRVVGDQASSRGAELRDVLGRNGVHYGYYDVDSEMGRDLVASTGIDRDRLPALILLDGRILHDPTNMEIADALGVSQLEDATYDVAIVGAGPAGLAAAVYASSEGLSTIVIECEALGGQAGMSSLIRNFLGFPQGITGADLAQRAYEQAWLFGAKYVLARRAAGVRMDGRHRIVRLDDGREIRTRAVLIATGAKYRRLGLERVDRFDGLGVFYNVGADLALALRGRDVVVCGGGNSAGQAVVHLAKRARRVIHVVRGGALAMSMSSYLVDQILQLPNVTLHFETEVADAEGDMRLAQVTLRNRTTGAVEVVSTSALFVMIGATPNVDWLRETVACDPNGFILTGDDVDPHEWPPAATRPPRLLETSMPGVFAAGDVRHGSTQRIASAMGDAAVAVAIMHDYLKQNPVDERMDTARAPHLGHGPPPASF